MATLPFVVRPRLEPIKELIGTEDSGQIEIERRGYLTSGEKAFVQQVLQFDNGTNELIGLARRVARRFSIKLDEAYSLVLRVISNATTEEDEYAEKIESEFAEEIAVVIRNLTSAQAKEELLTATCLLRYRVDPDFEMEDIVKIHPDIIAGLAALYKEEEAKSVERLEKSIEKEAETAEEIEKKPVKRIAKAI